MDGGSLCQHLLMQFQSDITGKDVIRPAVIETTGLGAAYLAGLATGYWKDKEEIRKNMAIDRVFTTEMSVEEAEEKLKGWKRAVKCAVIYSEM